MAHIGRVREKSHVRNHAYPIKKMSTIVVFTLSVRTLPVRSFLQTWPKTKWQGSSSYRACFVVGHDSGTYKACFAGDDTPRASPVPVGNDSELDRFCLVRLVS